VLVIVKTIQMPTEGCLDAGEDCRDAGEDFPNAA
jgi:hypothetical protein